MTVNRLTSEVVDLPSFESPSLLLPIAESEPVADAVAELAAMVERALDDCVWITAVAVDELFIERISGVQSKGCRTVSFL